MPLSRREFLRLAALGAGDLILASCGVTTGRFSAAPTPQSSSMPTTLPQSNLQKQLPVTTSRNSDFIGTEILGRSTKTSVAANVIPAKEMEVYFEYGAVAGNYPNQTTPIKSPAGTPIESVIDNLQPNTRYYYRTRYREPGASRFASGPECTFVTQRVPGSTFTFDVQGDSHPERPNQHNPDLYTRTLQNAASDQPDLYITIGDDFSVDTLKAFDAQTIGQRYLLQRPFLGLVANSAPLFLLNGNHEQAAAYLLDGTPNNVAVWAQQARNRYYSQPAPDGFYVGDSQPVEFIGLLRDYYAWTWGDALFVTIDPYWHSPVPVDTVLGGAPKSRNLWDITLGDVQYRWFVKTLQQSTAKYKFVFSHHVLGTGRGGIELADLYEWGGTNPHGVWEFDRMRPGWELPIHQLMVKHKVTIFLQGHDHLFAYQERDGIVYQELPEPADPGYVAYNDDAYKSGVKIANAGYLRVTVAPEQVKVDYIRSYLPKDEINGRKHGELAYSYTLTPKVK